MALGMGLRQRTNSAVVGLQHEVLGLASGELTSLSPPPAVLLGLVCPEQTLSVTRQRGTEEEEVRGEMNDIFKSSLCGGGGGQLWLCLHRDPGLELHPPLPEISNSGSQSVSLPVEQALRTLGDGYYYLHLLRKILRLRLGEACPKSQGKGPELLTVPC